MYNRAVAMAKENLGGGEVAPPLAVPQAGGEKAIDGGFGPGREITANHQFPGPFGEIGRTIVLDHGGMGGKKSTYHFLIFLGLQGTGGVNQNPTGGEQAGTGFEQTELFPPIDLEIFRLTIPADVGLTTNHSGAGAGGIDKDAITCAWQLCGSALQSGFMDRQAAAQAETGNIFPQPR
jgi:hypothetical protein